MDETMEIISLFAIFLGPIFAVLATRWLDEKRERRERKMTIFRTLMRTRRTPTSQEHVGGLNLIEIEFAAHPKVISAWKNLFEHFGNQHSRYSEESVAPDDSFDQTRQKNIKFEERLRAERQRLLAKLLHAMAKELNFTIEQLEIFEGGYLPQGWVDTESDGAVIRKFAANLAVGNALLPVGVVNVPEPNDIPVQSPDAPKP